jgi:signal transduction histidine kinase
VAVLGYSAFALLDIQNGGLRELTQSRHVLLSVITGAALLIAIRFDEILGCALAIAATWIEIQTAFHEATAFPAGGMLIMPVLVLGIGMLFGSRVSFVAAIVSLVATYFCIINSPAAAAGLPADSAYWFLTYGIAMFAVWALMALGLSGFTRVFDAMLASRKELADTIEYAPDGILVLNDEGVIQLANPAAQRLLRAQGEALVGQRFGHIIARLVGESATPAALSDPSRHASGDALLRFAGEPVTSVEASWRSMGDGRNQLLLRDVTQRMLAEEQRMTMESQLAHAQRMDAVGRLAGGLSHDFNNILTAVSGSAELLRLAHTDAERKELIDEIIDARDRGTSLTRQLLSFARRDVRQPRVLDVADAVRGMERLLKRVGGERLELVLDLTDGCHVSADPGQLEHALVNLIANARDAMPTGGTCTVTVRETHIPDAPPHVLLEVRDTGTGMPEGVVARAFEPFFTTKARGQGTGLGLASVHAMVTQCNGTVHIESAPGAGTCITIELPAVPDDVTEVVPPRPAQALAPGAHRILVAEDDSGTRRVVERLLTSAGYSVQLCVDGREAIAIVDTTSITIDLVLSDIMMPGHTGTEVAARVAAVRPGTPVLLMSGYAEDYLGGVLDDGAHHEVITKPFSGSALTAKIAEMIRATQTQSA